MQKQAQRWVRKELNCTERWNVVPGEERSEENLKEKKGGPSIMEVAWWLEGHSGTEMSKISYLVICVAST